MLHIILKNLTRKTDMKHRNDINFDQVLKKFIFVKRFFLSVFLANFLNLAFCNDLTLDQAIEKIKLLGGTHYQSLYKITGYPYSNPNMPSVWSNSYPLENNTRCSGISFILEKYFSNKPKKDIKVLDIGTDTGYISHCLADRNLTVHGVDSNNQLSNCISQEKELKKNISNQELKNIQKNCKSMWSNSFSGKESWQIKAANIVKDYNKLDNVTFETNIVDLEYVKNLKPGQYDSALFLSVLHWLNLDFGFDTTKEILNELLKKIPIIIIEATKKEKPTGGSVKVIQSLMELPENNEEFFKDLSNLSHYEIIPKSFMPVSRTVYILFSKPLKNKIVF